MPTFQGLVSEESVIALVEYVKSLRTTDAAVNRDGRRTERHGTGTLQRTGKTMASTAAPLVTYLNHEHSVASWLLTKDHKRIGLMYLVVVTCAFFVGGLFATIIRLELATPAGDLLSTTITTRCSPCTAWPWCSSC